MANVRNVEILIHITAPSRASDDVRYRSLASAYIDFQPQKPRRLSGPDVDPVVINPVLTTVTREVVSKSDFEIPPQIPSPEQWLPSLTSLQASFDDVIDNANSPVRPARWRSQPRGSRRAPSQNVGQQPSWETPPSLVPDSVPENDTTMAFLTTPTRVLEHYLQHFTSPSQNTQRQIHQRSALSQKRNSISPAKSSGASRVTTIPCTPENRLRPIYTSDDLDKPSYVLYSSQRQQGTSRSTRVPGSDEDIVEDTVILPGPETPPVDRAGSEPPPSKRARRNRSYASPKALLRTSSDIGPHKMPDGSRRTITFLPVHGYGYKNLELNPPEPSVGCATITAGDLITPSLEKLAAELKTPKRYNPVSTTRAIRPLERGYWTLDCTEWPQDLKNETWIFLANYIGTGLAGWGVSCRRDDRFSWLRLYCWGSLVAHIYLLAYLASRRRVGFSGATWIDGEGKVVIVMGKKEGVWIRM